MALWKKIGLTVLIVAASPCLIGFALALISLIFGPFDRAGEIGIKQPPKPTRLNLPPPAPAPALTNASSDRDYLVALRRAEAETAQQEADAKEKAAQWERHSAITGLIETGAIGPIDQRGQWVRMSVRTPFYLSDFEAKLGCCRVVCAYYQSGDSDCLGIVLVDARSGNEVGKFTPSGGLRMR